MTRSAQFEMVAEATHELVSGDREPRRAGPRSVRPQDVVVDMWENRTCSATMMACDGTRTTRRPAPPFSCSLQIKHHGRRSVLSF